jgi:predicted transcriptional regulator
MSRLPYYEQRTTVDIPRADPSMAGGQLAEAVAGAGAAMEDIRVNMQKRDDSIKKTMSARDHDRSLQELTTSLSTEDMADVNTFQKWKENAIAVTEETIANFQGTKSARAALREQLTNQMYQYEKSVRGQQIKAQHEMIGTMIEETTNQLSIDAGFAPETIGLTFESLDAQIDDLASGGAIPTEMAQQYKNSGRSAIAASAIQQLEARGQFETAEALLKDPSVGRFLKPDTARQLTIRVTAGKAKQQQETAQRQVNVQSWSMAMGIDPDQMTPQQRMIAENASTQTMNYVEKINLATALNGGQPLTLEQRNNILKIDRQGARTQMQELIADLPAFESGRMDDQERAMFLLRAEKMFPTQYRQDPDTGQPVAIPGSGGIAKINEAIGRSATTPRASRTPPGAPIGGTPAGSGQSDMDVDMSFTDDQGRTDFRARPAGGADMSQEDQADISIGSAPMTQQAGGLWNLADRIAGPVAGVRRGLGGGPVDIGIGQQEVAAAQEVQLQQRNLVRALQQNPRYAEGERKDIAESISIEPELLSNPTAYRTRLIEIGRYVQDEIKYNTSVLAQPASQTTSAMRQQAMQSIPLFQKFYERLGLPPTVKSPEEALKMSPRPRQVMSPDGRLFDVPQE